MVIGEFGSIDKTAFDSTNNTYREAFAKAVSGAVRKYGSVPIIWDNGHNRGWPTIAGTAAGQWTYGGMYSYNQQWQLVQHKLWFLIVSYKVLFLRHLG